jgi:hypothetical protein
MTRKVVYNACYGGFSLSLEAQKMYLEMSGKEPKFYKGKFSWEEHWYSAEPNDFYDRDIERHDPILVKVVETLGDKANGDCADLCITEVQGPYRIEEYDGYETVKEPEDLVWV